MNWSQTTRRKARLRRACTLLLLTLLLLAGCKRGALKTEVAYIAAPQANLRDRVAAVYNKVGTVYNGEVVEVLEKSRRFVKVKSRRGEIGWIEQRYLVDESVFAGFQTLAKESAPLAPQARGLTRASLNMHLTPGRDTEHLYQLKDGDRVDILKRATAEKRQAGNVQAALKEKAPGTKPGDKAQVRLEDWLLVRDAQGRTGWVLSRMIDLDVPLEVAQYAEGQRIVAAFVLNHVQDGDKRVPQYLMLLTDNKDGQPWDYNQARIFTWNVKRHRYETAYRERKLIGMLPVRVGSEDFGKEGVLPVFELRVQDEQGNTLEKKYRLIGPIVRRVFSPEEEQAQASARTTTPKKRK